MTPSEERYYRAVEGDGPVLVLFGEESERWTDVVSKILIGQSVPFTFLPWEGVPDVRLQCELVRYPTLQLWNNTALELEMVGYQAGRLRQLMKRYSMLKRG